MKLKLETQVVGNYKEVMQAFDLKLFEVLKPPIGKMEVVEFTGSKKGDKVHLRFISPMKAEWVSDIVEDGVTDSLAYFVDVGVKLPWPLATWQHRHVVKRIDDDHSLIVDDITYTASNGLLTLLMYPALYISFFPRKSVYRSYFKDLFGR